MRVEAVMRDRLLAEIPNLRAFALTLTQDADEADTLVQDTLVRAWNRMSTFDRGTNLSAWLFTILRKRFYSQRRIGQPDVDDSAVIWAKHLFRAPERCRRLDTARCQTALATLNPRQREALILVTAQGLSYEDAASICGVSIRTIRSRVARGHAHLAHLLSIRHTQDGDTPAPLKRQAKSLHIVQ
jgi:RNA polymerase sigma-70 factor (ECF subfamily)